MIPVLFTVLTAVAMLALPFRLAVLVLAVWIVWAMCEVVVWAYALRVERRRQEIRALIEREMASIPRVDESPRRPILPFDAHFPHAWRPFIGHRRNLSAPRHAAR